MDTLFIDSSQMETRQYEEECFPFMLYYDRYYNNSYPWHWHDEIEFGYVEKGKLLVGINQSTCEISERNGAFLNSGSLHTVCGISNAEVSFPNILFHPSLIYGSKESVFYKKYIECLIGRPDCPFLLLEKRIDWQARILALLKEVICVMNGKDAGYEFRIREMISEMLLLILDHCAESTAEIPDSGNQRNLYRLRRMIDYVTKHYTENVSLADIAASADVSERECQLFYTVVLQKNRDVSKQFPENQDELLLHPMRSQECCHCFT